MKVKDEAGLRHCVAELIAAIGRESSVVGKQNGDDKMIRAPPMTTP